MAAHGTYGSYSNGCRCEPCRDAMRASKRAAKARAAATGDIPHGTLNGYGNLGCRCQPCRGANAAAMRRRAAMPVDPALCPSDLNYHRGCRCEGCREKHNAPYRDRYRNSRPAGVRPMRKPVKPDPAPLVPLGVAIRDNRRIAGLTQGDLAEALSVSVAAVSLWERGRLDPGAARLPVIARAIGCPLADLVREMEDAAA